MKEGNVEVAISEYRVILNLDKHNTPALVNLGAIHFFRGEWAEAAANLNAAQPAAHALWKPEALLGMTEIRLGDAQRAELHLSEAFAKLKDDRVRLQTGLELLDLCYASNDWEKAADVVAALKRVAPDNPDVLYSAARIYDDLADQARDNLASVAPDSGRVHEIMAEHLVNMAKVEEAIVQYEEALEKDPKLPGIHYELGEAFLHRSSQAADLDRAEREFRLAAAENPSNADPQYQLGVIYQLRSDLNSAEQFFSHALKLEPKHAMAQLGLGSVLMTMDQPESALPHLLTASQLVPSNPAVHYKLAAAYRKLGRPTDATREQAEFQKLWQDQKKVDQLYSEMHESVRRSPEPNVEVPDAGK
jgi:tetratricopeptide (TPR) repeat protein